MGKSTRRQFLGWTGLIAGAAASGSCVGGARQSSAFEPDLVVLNGRIYTMDDDLPRAEALAVKSGRFVAVGSSQDVANLVSSSSEVIGRRGDDDHPRFH